MSVEKRTNGDGTRSWRVRWRDGDRNRSRTFATKRDAELFEADLGGAGGSARSRSSIPGR